MLNALKHLVRIGVVKLVKSSLKTQTLQVQTIGEEVIDNVKHIEPYGFTSCPKIGSECVVLNLNGFGSKPIAIVCGGREFRMKNLEQGEVALYTDEGDSLVFKRGGIIEATTTTFKINGDAEITGDLAVTGNISSTGELFDKTSNITAIRTVFDAHVHTLSNVPTSEPAEKMGG